MIIRSVYMGLIKAAISTNNVIQQISSNGIKNYNRRNFTFLAKFLVIWLFYGLYAVTDFVGCLCLC